MTMIFEKIFEYLWVDVALILYFILVVFFSFRKKYVFFPESIAGNLPERFASFIDINEDFLLEKYWIRLGSFRCSNPKEDVTVFANFYSSPDYMHHALLAELESSVEVFYFIVFPIRITMMHNQNPLILDSAPGTFFWFAESFQQAPGNSLTGYPIRRVFPASPVFIFP